MSLAPDGTKVAIAERRITEKASKRVAIVALEACLQRQRINQLRDIQQRPKLTIVHKSNVLRFFLHIIRVDLI